MSSMNGLPLPRSRGAFGQTLSEDGLLVALRAENAGRSFAGGEHEAMLLAVGLDAVTVTDPARVKLVLIDQHQAKEALGSVLASDDSAGFMGRMKKKDRQAIEEQRAKVGRYIDLLDVALRKAEERVGMGQERLE